MIASGQHGGETAGTGVVGHEHEIVIALLEQHRAAIAVQIRIVNHPVVVVETPVVQRAHDIDLHVFHRIVPLQEEIHPHVIRLSGVVEVLVFDINELLSMDVLVGGIRLMRPRLAGGDVNLIPIVGLTDVGEIFRLKTMVAGVETAVLVGALENRQRVVLEGDVIGIDVRRLQAHDGIVPTTILADGEIAILLNVRRRTAVNPRLDIQLLVRVGQREVVGIARHRSTHMHPLIDHHETAREIDILLAHVVAKNDEQVIARNQRPHVFLRENQSVVDIIHQRIHGESIVVEAVRIETRSVFDALHISGIPVVRAMDKGVIQHLATARHDVERQGQTPHHVVQRDDRFAQLFAIAIQLNGLNLSLVRQISARQIEVLGKDTRRDAEREQKVKISLHLIHFQGNARLRCKSMKDLPLKKKTTKISVASRNFIIFALLKSDKI